MASAQFSVAFVTTSGVAQARKIADELVAQKLAACCNIVPKIESIYRWEGKIERDAEALMIIKTRKSLEKRVIKRVRELHSYSVPEVIFMPIQNGNPDYMKWLAESTSAKSK